MTNQLDPEEQRLESVYESMLTALARRDVGLLDELLADDVEFRSYATGPETMRGKSEVLEAVKATRDRIFDPVLLGFEHLGDGWLIAAARLRHSAEGGWMADSRKAALARVVDAKVHVESRLFDGRGGSRGVHGAAAGRSVVTVRAGGSGVT